MALSFSPTVPFIQVFQHKEKIEILPEDMLFCQLMNRLLWCSVWILTKRYKYNMSNLVLNIYKIY